MYDARKLLQPVRTSRWFEVVVGASIALLAGPLALGAIGCMVLALTGNAPAGIFAAGAIVASIAVPSLSVAWKLLFGRRRKNGEGALLSPAALRIAGVCFIVAPVCFLHKWGGVELWIIMVINGIACFQLARLRSRVKRVQRKGIELLVNLADRRVSAKVREVLARSQQLARDCNRGFLGTEHLLWALASFDGSVAMQVLKKQGIELGAIRDELSQLFEPATPASRMDDLAATPRCRNAIEASLEFARRAGHDRVGTGHLLLGLVADEDNSAYQVLEILGVSFPELLAATLLAGRDERHEVMLTAR